MAPGGFRPVTSIYYIWIRQVGAYGYQEVGRCWNPTLTGSLPFFLNSLPDAEQTVFSRGLTLYPYAYNIVRSVVHMVSSPSSSNSRPNFSVEIPHSLLMTPYPVFSTTFHLDFPFVPFTFSLSITFTNTTLTTLTSLLTPPFPLLQTHTHSDHSPLCHQPRREE